MAVSQSEILRFFALRAPKKAEPTQENGFTSIDPTLLAGSGTYLTDLVTARAQDTGANEQRAAMIIRTEQFNESAEYYSSTSDLLTDYSNYGIQPFYNWLIVNGEAASAAEIETNANSLLGVIYTDFLDHEQTNLLRKSVWENLTSQMIIQTSVPIRELLQITLRVSNILEILRDLPALLSTAEKRKRIINSKIVLPNEIFPVPKPMQVEQETPPSPSDKIKQSRLNLAKEWHGYHSAAEEIRKKHNCLIDTTRLNNSSRFMPVGSSSLPEDFSSDFSNDFTNPIKVPYIDYRTLDKNLLSPSTLFVLEKIWCNGASRINVKDALDRLQKKMEEVSVELSKTYEPFDRVTLIGGSLLQHNKDAVQFDTAVGTGDGDEKCKITSLGIADLRIIEQELLCYEPGEVAHIENILEGEYKNRTTRRLSRREETTTTETIRETESEKDVQTTDRFEMHQETASVAQNDQQFHVGVQVSASYGFAQINTDLGYASNSSTTQSDSQSVEYGKSVTERARQRVFERVRQEKTVTIIEEFEETNQHGFGSSGAGLAGNLVGIYRWVNKKYRAKVKNYGKRLMYQFVLPEPALFHIHAMKENPMEGVTLEKPKDPRKGVNLLSPDLPNNLTMLRSPYDVATSNYLLWAGLYDAKVPPPPPETQIIGKAFKSDSAEEETKVLDENTLKIPTGYLASLAYINAKSPWTIQEPFQECLIVKIGRRELVYEDSENGIHEYSEPLDNETGDIPVSILSKTKSIPAETDIRNWFVLNIEITCTRSDELLDKWKIDAYESIMSAYQEKKAAYDSAVAQVTAQAGIIQIRGNNPLRNREIERLELKKGCIQMMRGKPWNVNEFKSMNYDPSLEPPYSYPEFNNCEAIKDGKEIQFIEQAFEWNQVTYELYPYFWGKKSRWTMLYTIEDNDPIFTAFLQAGAARVIVPVRPGYEDAVVQYMESGEIWSGGDIPSMRDKGDLYVSVYDDLLKKDPPVEGLPWEIVLPTNLVILQQKYEGLADVGLPCFEEEPV